MKKGIAALDLRFYRDYPDNWDDWLFRDTILNRVRDSDCILDIGAGIGFVKEMHFRGRVARVCGLDPEASVLNNPHLDEGKVGFGEKIPWPDASFDLVFADNVLEHLPDPDAVFREVSRVLKPGGYFLVKTPNRFHYVSLIAHATPASFHKMFNKFRGRDDSHTFKTYYRANSKGKIMRLAKRSGLSIRELQRIEGRPEYLRFSTITYLLGLIYERTVNKFDALSQFRILLVGIFQKPPNTGRNIQIQTLGCKSSFNH
jgi:SAM-dependent methyltransferase